MLGLNEEKYSPWLKKTAKRRKDCDASERRRSGSEPSSKKKVQLPIAILYADPRGGRIYEDLSNAASDKAGMLPFPEQSWNSSKHSAHRFICQDQTASLD
jgi:hypothetical protein